MARKSAGFNEEFFHLFVKSQLQVEQKFRISLSQPDMHDQLPLIYQ